MGKLTSLVPPNMHQLELCWGGEPQIQTKPLIAVILIDFIDMNVLPFKLNFQHW